MKNGVIQTGGIGDIVIALPIAKYFYDDINEVFWPIDENFLPSFQEVAPQVNWIGISRDDADFFYQTPFVLLAKKNVERTIVPYSFLSSHLELADNLLQKVLKFDQYKYTISNAPFPKKWTLENCL